MLGLVVTLGQATAYVFSGMYGDMKDLGVINSVLMVVGLNAFHTIDSHTLVAMKSEMPEPRP